MRSNHAGYASDATPGNRSRGLFRSFDGQVHAPSRSFGEGPPEASSKPPRVERERRRAVGTRSRSPEGASLILIATCLMVGANTARAQEAMYTAAATMPSPHVALLREQLNFTRFGRDPNTNVRHTENVDLDTSLSLGLARGLALYVDMPGGLRWQTDDATGVQHHDHGLADPDVMLKWRVYQNDSGGIDTARVALMGGAKFASGDDHDYSSGSLNPHVGAVFTMVRGRSGFNQEFHFQLNTHGDDSFNVGGDGAAEALRSNTSYLYRIDPPAFTADSKGAWYATVE